MDEIIKHFLNTIDSYKAVESLLQNKKRKFGSIELYSSEIHTLVYIFEHEDSNFTEIALGMEITKGALTRLTNKIEAKGLIKRYKRDNDHKAVYFRVTESGMESYNAHRLFHQQFRIETEESFQQFLDENRSVLEDFLCRTDELFSQMILSIDRLETEGEAQ
ncbi:MAG: MarR family transcriptional regulator [Spirochaetales bacterium]|nr:MarR family transcriptional regulator [Spirochaetales bacterium]